ncbi:Tma16p [Kluyveromyces lactis]|uniref:KLLA0C09889p n=1 Tax=Kluyveromyces lactis (strain ATCC 8585 / CBS 2359 / DSM 70799 / NBRC 1267 / NRRL Y-1140 / WM37) TaxID=284590 RepID=Q6CTV0_KLULA|nr:uncharacterized protein KLLA0_C09889g [Kluyveromyces lactis]CAH01490.1 KLLA0C09889p [Kluyveromyces lactis]|eukprot:XP_452639.1 uncharacterized protein KLLA0_C09889g [Kluyveromyces lactis]
MPVTKSLGKIQKGLKGKKFTVHPKGRKFQQLNRATLREEKVQAKKRAHNEKRSNELARMTFVQSAIKTDSLKEKEVFDYKETAVLIQEFIARDDNELNELKSKRRQNRPPTGRQQLLQHKRDLEMEEFKSGFLCPDLTDPENVIFLRAWNQTFGGLSTLKLIRINDKGEKVLGGTKPVKPIGELKDIEMN